MDILDVREMYTFGEKVDLIFFYGHTPKVPNTIDNSCFSQWYPSTFTTPMGVTYHNCEQYMMHQKALLFDDIDLANRIMDTTDPRQIKMLGRQVVGFNAPDWDIVKYSIVKDANIMKFAQNVEMLLWLMDTRESILVEASPSDIVWGIGMAKTDIGVDNPCNWVGQNLLGFALMDARESLRKLLSNSSGG
jgi:ribA/ribD-fused uncharacterized protein